MKTVKYVFDIEKIVSFLEKYKDGIKELYKWNSNINRLEELKILTKKEIKDLNKLLPYEREIKLKTIINNQLQNFKKTNNDSFEKLCLWIIKDWGRITSAEDSKTINLIREFIETRKAKFDRIASVSKVGSFLYPEENVIYDSRVIYSLNWIILSQKAGNNYFPIPEGRNSKMKSFDMNVLIKLVNISKYRPEDKEAFSNQKYIHNRNQLIYINKSEAYQELNNLLTKVNRKLWSSDKSKYLYFTEMLLFAIADTEIFTDITNRVSITIN